VSKCSSEPSRASSSKSRGSEHRGEQCADEHRADADQFEFFRFTTDCKRKQGADDQEKHQRIRPIAFAPREERELAREHRFHGDGETHCEPLDDVVNAMSSTLLAAMSTA
jgi:hypothetical protein